MSIDNDDVTLDGSYRYFLHLTTSDGTPIAGQEILYPEGSEDNWQALLTDEHGNAYFGPRDGFTLDDEPALTSDEGVTTPFKVTMPSGIYRLHVGLVDVTNGQEVIGGLASISFDVLPVVEYSFQNFDDLRSNREGDVSVTVIVHHPEIIGEEKFLRYRAELLRDDSPVSNLDIQYFDLASDDWNTFTTNNEGVAYFGPASGFTLAQLPDLTGGGVTTTFRAKLPRGGYELSLRIVDVSDPNNPVDITNVPAGTVTFRVQQNNSSRVEDVLPDTTPSPEQQSPRTPAPSSDTQPVSSDTTTIAKAGIEAFDLAVTVPAGALEGSGSLSVEAVDEGDQPEPGAGRFMIGNQVFEIVVEDEEGNNVRQFNRPLTLSFEYDPSALPDDVSEEDLYVYYWHEQLGNWVLLPTERDAATGQITATVNHLTTFTLMAVPNLQIPYDLKGHWSENDVLKLIDLDIVSGYADGSIQPNRTVTRAEFTKMLVGAMGLQPLTMPRLEFADAHVVPAWSHGYVAAAVRAGIITGFADNSFRADTPITREQLATMVIRALESLEQNGNGSADNESSLVFSDAVHISEWARDAVAAATELGIVTGMADGTFRPAQTATRAEAATMLSRLIEVTASR